MLAFELLSVTTIPDAPAGAERVTLTIPEPPLEIKMGVTEIPLSVGVEAELGGGVMVKLDEVMLAPE